MLNSKKYYEETKWEGIFRTTFSIEHANEGFLLSDGTFIRKLKDIDWNEFSKSMIEKNHINNYDYDDNTECLLRHNFIMIYIHENSDKRIYYNAYDGRTYKQIEYLNKHNIIVGEFDVLIKCKQLTREEHERLRKIRIAEKQRLDEYYSKHENQFHSPSGFPRIGYLAWKNNQ
jgi:hypothetical protein